MDFLLEVDTGRAKGTDDHVGADATIAREIAVGIGDTDVGGIVAQRVGGLLERGMRDREGRTLTLRMRRAGDNEQA
ncbi:MAG TPA: hypothetical protein VMG55_03440 [Stellaceae bacterium]|nr:hypothetical protein [Stellaceae bacterium]